MSLPTCMFAAKKPWAVALALAVMGLQLAGCSCTPSDKSNQDQSKSDTDVATPPAKVEWDKSKAAGDKRPGIPDLERARETFRDVEKKVRDYSAIFAARERIGDKLADRRVFIKIRHKPFSIYACALTPADRKGEEAIYVEGQNDGRVLAHTTGVTGWALGTLRLAPDDPLFMKDQRHPVTEIGILNLGRRWLTELGRKPSGGDVKVTISGGVKINGRPATCLEVMAPDRDEGVPFHVARVFVDDQLLVPIHYEGYDWPKTPGDDPPLLEQYSYSDLKLNQGLTDADFDKANPKYGFK